MPLYADLLQELAMRRCVVKIVRPLYNELGKRGMLNSSLSQPIEPDEVGRDNSLALLSVGGDGTFLEAARLTMNSETPVLGINNGRLGFLSAVPKDKVADALDSLLKGTYRIVRRDVLSVYANGSRDALDYGLNEFAVTKSDNSSMLTIHAYVDGEYLSTYWADGLIISTATGSTAYSMSVGGPIASPLAHDFIISPLAPHNLNVRPLILPNTVAITLRIEGRGQTILTSCDARNHVMDNGCSLRIAKAPFEVKVVELTEHSFFATLRDKLLWGADPRN